MSRDCLGGHRLVQPRGNGRLFDLPRLCRQRWLQPRLTGRRLALARQRLIQP
ncbi:hypothetical protein EV192_121108 [Actinocrispum wychmicini]|uniref:Uncharacterized protein n=1 Tax=Actinocrispum wychmicini TaxID=1213861 RepID=A0A4R2IK47_9PSEU|nr:hypothetical protein EV192_121108 [Actinocrispum wychmicini]